MKYLAAFSLLVCFSAGSFGQQEKRIIILHTNDMHSRLTGFGPEASYTPLTINDDKTVGGFARIAAIIKDTRDLNPENTLVIDAGDFLMGTLFHTVEPETGFQLPLMKKMGYDAVSLGNHEFDFGIPWLSSVIRTSQKTGEMPELLLGNAVFSQSDNRDDDLEALFNGQLIKRSLVLERAGLKIGLFSLMGTDAAWKAPYAKPVTFEKQIRFAARTVSELKARDCDLVICISHSGLTKDKNGNWTGEDAELAAKVKGINLIISAHTHSLLGEPVIVNGVPVVQAGEYGQYVGKTVLTGSNGKYSVESYGLIPVDDRIMGDTETDAMISIQKQKITGKILEPFGMTYSQPVAENQVVLHCDQQTNLDESNLGPLVADAIHYYINKHSSPGADMSMVSAGVIRDRMISGIQTPPDVFRIMPLGSGKDNVPGYAFSRLYITGREMKNILEILLIAYKSDPDYYCFFSGIRVEYDPGKGLLKKVKKIDIVKPGGQVVPVDISKKNKTLYSVTANSYMLEFIGVIRKKSFGLINVVPKNSGGEKVTDMSTAVIDMDERNPGVQEGKEWLALMEYLRQMKDTDGNGIPNLEMKYFQPVRALLPVK